MKSHQFSSALIRYFAIAGARWIDVHRGDVIALARLVLDARDVENLLPRALGHRVQRGRISRTVSTAFTCVFTRKWVRREVACCGVS